MVTPSAFQPRPFKINVSEIDLKDLRSRLASDLKRLGSVGQESLEDTFEDGMNSRYLTQILGPYWLNKYEWRKSEKRINQMGQHFKVTCFSLFLSLADFLDCFVLFLDPFFLD